MSKPLKPTDRPIQRVRTAADDLGESRQPALRPVFKKVAPLLVNQFQKGMRQLSPSARKKVITTYFGRVNPTGDPTSKKNLKMMRDILVKALIQDRGWLEFVAEQILDGSTKELASVLDKSKTASMKTSAFMKPEYFRGTMYSSPDGHLYPADDFSKEQVAEAENCSVEDIETQSGHWARLSAPGYMDASDWGGPFESQAEARKYIEETYDVDPETGDDLDDVHEASVKTSSFRSVEGIFDGNYPLMPEDFSGVTFPVQMKLPGQSDAWYTIALAARETGCMSGLDLYIHDAESASDLFYVLQDLAEEAEQGAIADGEDEDSLSDVHDPAYTLATAMGM